MRVILFLLVTTVVVAGPLDQPVSELRFDRAALGDAMRTVARAHGVNLSLPSEMKGEVTLELSGGTVRDAFEAILRPQGLHFEETGSVVIVKAQRTALYLVEFPQLSRSGSGSASITLGGANNGNYGGGYGNTAPLQNLALRNGEYGAGSDATQISISQDNPNTFWANLEAELKSMLREGERLVLNRFSGIAQVTASAESHASVEAFLKLVNQRISRQVEIDVRLVEVVLREEQKLGIDWELATQSLGDLAVSGTAPLNVPGVGGALLGANSFTANLGFSQATAVIQALEHQGEVRTVAQPRLRALNNQSSFIKVGEDRPFFRLQQSTTFQQGGTQVPVNQTQEQFSVSTITIGTILAVTPQIDSEGTITLDVLPAITRLQSIVTSPDGRQTAPATEVKQASTIVRLRDGETAVIGGLISEESGETERAVPGLRRIPGLGHAFRSKAKLRVRTELVIFLTPRLVH